MANPLVFRWMTLDDLDEVMVIEASTFSNPWARVAYENELANNRLATYLVAEIDDQIVGFCGIWVIVDQSHITNVAVLPTYQGQGIGGRMMRKAMSLARMKKATSMSLEVRVSNVAAQRLYQKLGFEKGGIRKRYYTDNHEDALVMWVML